MTPEDASRYLNGKFRSYDERAVRYRLSAYAMIIMGLGEYDSVMDIGGGDAEMQKCLREEFGWKGPYTNADWAHGVDIFDDIIDGGVIGGSQAEHRYHWEHDFVTCLEVVEHFDLSDAMRMLDELPGFARKGIVFTTPDARVQNVRAMDPTHRTGLGPGHFIRRAYTVERHMLYDGYYSSGEVDGLIAYKQLQPQH